MHISTNLAISADGKISPSREVAGAFTGKEDSERFHQLRAKCDALLVGRGTLEADNMSLLVRDAPEAQQPLRCVISHSGNFDFQHKLFHTPGGPIHLIVTGATDREQSCSAPAELPAGVTWHQSSLAEFLDWLEGQGIQHLHCEGGGGVIHELASFGRIDQFHLTIAASQLFGGRLAPTPTGDSRSPYLPSSVHFSLSEWTATPDGEVLASYQARAPEAGAMPR